MIHEACELWRKGWKILDIKKELGITLYEISTFQLLTNMAKYLGYSNHIKMIESRNHENYIPVVSHS